MTDIGAIDPNDVSVIALEMAAETATGTANDVSVAKTVAHAMSRMKM
jgi:hypothetical protein